VLAVPSDRGCCVGYYIRVLSQSTKPVTLAAVQRAVAETRLGARIEDVRKDGRVLVRFTVVTKEGDPVLVFERNPVEEGSVGKGDVEDFLEQLPDAKPASAARWLAAFLPRVKVVYALQLFGRDSHRAAISAVRDLCWTPGQSIIQADFEGFSNDAGYHILWQFSDRVRGGWWMAVLGKDGTWKRFRMNLGNRAHRKAFLAGRVPAGVQVKRD